MNGRKPLPAAPARALIVLLALAAAHGAVGAQQTPFIKRLAVPTRAEVAELRCDPKPVVTRPPSSPPLDPMEIPSTELLEEAAPVSSAEDTLQARTGVPAQGPLRMAIWGDSHLAANFFTETLSKLLNIPGEARMHALIPANMGKAGVRLPIKQSCVSAQWKTELGYLGGEAAGAPGPGLVNMVSEQAGATLAWDVRKSGPASEQNRGHERVRILYQQTGSPIVIGIGADGEPEQSVTLDGAAGPAMLELVAPAGQAISQLRLRLIEGRLRVHGLELMPAQESPFVMDVFGYPGATVASWKNADLGYLASWFGQRDYQMVMLEFGTNEGNVKPFDSGVYRRLLTESVSNMRSVFPQAACMLIAPGDRGVLVPRSANIHPTKSARGGKHRVASKARKPSVDLMQYARIHAEIGRIQAAVAADAGCGVWSMQTAMGGPGSAYRWARQSPPLMAKDLIHFTVAGYQKLAQQFVKDMGWRAVAPDSDSARSAPR